MPVDPVSLDSLLTLIDCMERTDRLTDEEIEEKSKPYNRALFREMANSGKTLGEVRGGTLSFLNQEDARSEIKNRNNDLSWQTGVISGCFSEFLTKGEIPPPYYAERICIILRKSSRRDIERRFLAAWLLHFSGRGYGSRYRKLETR